MTACPVLVSSLGASWYVVEAKELCLPDCLGKHQPSRSFPRLRLMSVPVNSNLEGITIINRYLLPMILGISWYMYLCNFRFPEMPLSYQCCVQAGSIIGS